MKNKKYYVYFLESVKNEKIYVGSTEKIPGDRLEDHNYGSNKWTRENGPFKLVYFEGYFCKKDAQEREKFYKTGFGRLIRNSIIIAVKDIER